MSLSAADFYVAVTGMVFPAPSQLQADYSSCVPPWENGMGVQPAHWKNVRSHALTDCIPSTPSVGKRDLWKMWLLVFLG